MTQPSAQLRMPGMPWRRWAPVSRSRLSPGAEVEYVGRIAGGPRYGAMGVVKGVLARRALVDMGMSGKWLVPYYFLGVPGEAA